MTETTEKSAPPEKIPEKPKAEPNTGAKPVRKNGSGGLAKSVDILFNLVLVGSIGYVGYMVYEQNKAVNVLFQQQNDFTTTISRVDAVNVRIEALQEEIRRQETAIAQLREESTARSESFTAEMDRLQNELVSTRLRITSNSPGASQEWLLAEAASLLRLAQQHMVVGKSMRTAQALFIAADDVLEQIDDPAIFAVREVLASELASIRAVVEVDVRGIFLEIGALSEQLGTLQVSNDLANQVAEGERVTFSGEQTSDDDGEAGNFFSWFTQTLDDYFVVRRRDEPLQALMTPGQEAALVQYIRLQLEQARTALLKEEQEIYSSSLELAQETINAYLAGDEMVRAQILADLDTLKSRRIVTEPPSLSRTRAALEQILSARAPQSESAGQ